MRTLIILINLLVAGIAILICWIAYEYSKMEIKKLEEEGVSRRQQT